MSLFEEKTSGFEKQASALAAASAGGRLAHAYLLHGDNEDVRRNFATALAMLAACPTPNPNGSPCSSCQVCRQIADSAYPEAFVLEPNSKSRQIKIGDDNTVGTVRWFMDQLSLSSVAPGKRKVGIILDTDRMGAGAQNAFLKTLEEPPRDTILILATANPAALLPTIISRCHVVSILTNRIEYAFPGVDEAAEALARLGSCATGGGLKAARESANELTSVLDALAGEAEKSVGPSWDARFEELENFVASLPPAGKKDFKTRLNALKEGREAAVKGEQVKLLSELLSFVHAWFAQIYQVSMGIPPENLTNPEIFRHFDVRKLAGTPAESARDLERAEKLLDDLRWNVDRRLAVAAFCCSFVEDSKCRRAS